jgi:hypothetical protein
MNDTIIYRLPDRWLSWVCIKDRPRNWTRLIPYSVAHEIVAVWNHMACAIWGHDFVLMDEYAVGQGDTPDEFWIPPVDSHGYDHRRCPDCCKLLTTNDRRRTISR